MGMYYRVKSPPVE